MPRKAKRILVISDTHCGHLFGLTPPKYQTNKTPGNTDEHGKPYGIYESAAETQRELWNWFAKRIRAGKPFDAVVLNGDAIDGKGEKSGTIEQLTTDRNRQADMVADILGMIDAEATFMTFGTPYHTGVAEDWELVVCDKYPVDKITSQLFLEVYGMVFDIKHHISGTSVPYSVHTAPTKQRVLNILAADQGQAPRADFVIRSHIHKFSQGVTRSGESVVTPGLQAWSKYGARRVDTDIDMGLCWYDIYEGGNHSFYWDLADIECRKPTVVKL